MRFFRRKIPSLTSQNPIAEGDLGWIFAITVKVLNSYDKFENVNSIIGENSTGRTFLLKTLYFAMKTMKGVVFNFEVAFPFREHQILQISKGEIMMKKIFSLFFLVVTATLLSGCTIYLEGRYTFNGDNTVTVSERSGYDTATIESMYTEEQYSQLELITAGDGTQFYVSEWETNTLTGNPDSTYLITKDIVKIDAAVSAEELQSYKEKSEIINAVQEFSVTTDTEWVSTNGILSADKKTVTFMLSYSNPPTEPFYAYTLAGQALANSDTTAPTIQGISSNKWYKKVKNIKFTAQDESGVYSVHFSNMIDAHNDDYGVASVKPNNQSGSVVWIGTGKDVKFKDANGEIIDDKYDNFKEGINYITVTDMVGNKTVKEFKYDSKAPSVKNIKKNKIFKKGKAVFYVKDDGSGLKKVTFNGKKVKSVKKVKSGKYKGYSKVTVKVSKTTKGTVKLFDKIGHTKSYKIIIKK